MKTSKVLATGFFAGAVIGGGVTFLEVAPATVAVLMKPLEWLTEGLHPYPRESLANLIIAWPLWLLYWGLLGVGTVLLARCLYRVIMKLIQYSSTRRP